MDQEVDLKSSKYVSTSYAVSKLDEKTDLDESPATQPHTRVLSIRTFGSDKFVGGADEGHHGSSERFAEDGPHGSSDKHEDDRSSDTSRGNQSSSDKHKDGQFHGDGLRHEAIADEHDSDKEEQNSKDENQDGQLQGDDSRPEPHAFGVSRDNADQETIEEYSAESRTYHAYYDEVGTSEYTPSELLADNNHSSNVPNLLGHYTWCRDHCLHLLLEPRIPLWTRIQTLQLLSTMLQPAGGEQCLTEADQIIDKLNPDQFQTKLLREDNRKMMADREAWRVEHNLVGQDIEGISDRGVKLTDEPIEGEDFRKPEADVETADSTSGKTAGMLWPASSEIG
jgi:hypothetical protein